MSYIDFSTLAARMSAGLDGVRACLILSSDGLTLGVYPESGEERARHAWVRLQEVGDPQRGFVDIGEEMWVLVRRGPYAGILVTSPGVRPGLMIDKLEFLLRAVEEARAREAAELGSPPPRPEATRRPRTSLHEKPKTAPATPATTSPPAAPAQPAAFRARAERSPEYTPPPALQGAAKTVIDVTTEEASDAPSDSPVDQAVVEAAPGPKRLEEAVRSAEAASVPGPSPRGPAAAPNSGDGSQPDVRPLAPPAPRTADAEVDRVALAREFGRLLAEGGSGGDR